MISGRRVDPLLPWSAGLSGLPKNKEMSLIIFNAVFFRHFAGIQAFWTDCFNKPSENCWTTNPSTPKWPHWACSFAALTYLFNIVLGKIFLLELSDLNLGGNVRKMWHFIFRSCMRIKIANLYTYFMNFIYYIGVGLDDPCDLFQPHDSKSADTALRFKSK